MNELSNPSAPVGPAAGQTARPARGGSAGRGAVLAALRQVDVAWPVGQIAVEVGLSPSTTRFHLDHLVDEGLVRAEKEPRSVPGRRRLLYRAVPAEAVDEAAAYRSLARLLAEEMAAAMRADDQSEVGAALSGSGFPAEVAAGGSLAERAGRRWARSVLPARPAVAAHPGSGASRARALGAVVELLADHGFEPELDDAHSVVRLHRCPFREVAQEQPGVVCAVHLGLLREALDRLGAPVAATAIEPVLDGSSPCVAHLAERERS